LGVFWGIRQLRYVEFSELGELAQRAVVRRRIMTNNVNVRRAAEALAFCKDRDGLCRILQETFEPLGFDGFCLENSRLAGFTDSSFDPLVSDAKGKLLYKWSGEDGLEPAWELRLQLPSNGDQPIGHLSLFQMEEDRPLLFDLQVVTNGVRTSISNAIHRTIPQVKGSGERALAAGQE
jgi:hypothetical protein